MAWVNRLKQGLAAFGWLAALAGAGAVSCRDASDDELAEGGPSCEELATHVGRLCNYTFGRQAELSCEMLGASRSTRECVLRRNQCSTCGLASITSECTVDSDCPGDLVCHPERQVCTECVSDADCVAPRYCPDGFCILMPECFSNNDCEPPAVCNAKECRVLSPCESDADCVHPDQCTLNSFGNGWVCKVIN